MTVGRIRNKAIGEEVERLARSVRGEWKIDISSVPDSPVKDPAARRSRETKDLLSKVPKNCEAVPLTPEGKHMDSGQFAAFLAGFKDSGKKVCFLIGGAHGLDRSLLPEGAAPLSLSKMTFTHELSLLVLMEQVYRGYTLYNNIPYSK